MWCERHKCRKTRNWQKLCQTRADYRQAWEEGRGPGQTHGEAASKPRDEALLLTVRYLKCPHRGAVVAETTGNMVGIGCGSTKVEFFECQHFHEPVLKGCKTWAWDRNRDKINAICPAFNGRTCRECELWKLTTT